ncbi:MAG: TRAP transporter large permease subunit [Rhizobiales bacterium]|nr:TRAP transporter large permease subunit [Hyphomicrobiales bacterium]
MDPIWFGVFVVINAEISVISPPVGMNVFLVKSMFPEIGIWEIFNGTWPFFFAALVLLAIVIVWPSTVTFLPSMMR